MQLRWHCGPQLWRQQTECTAASKCRRGCWEPAAPSAAPGLPCLPCWKQPCLASLWSGYCYWLCPCPVLAYRPDRTVTEYIGKLILEHVLYYTPVCICKAACLSKQSSWHTVSTAMLCGPVVGRHMPCLHVSTHANQPGANDHNSIRSAAMPFQSTRLCM